MSIVKKKTKTVNLNIRIPETLNDRIQASFDKCVVLQPDVNKSELIRDAIERGLDSIDSELKANDLPTQINTP